MSNYSGAHICQCLSRLTTVRRNSPVTIAGDRRKTGEQFVEGVLGLARGLLELGLHTGDVVALCALNSDLYLEWLLAVAFVGGIAAPLNYRWSLEDARSAMDDIRPVMLVTDECSTYWYSELQVLKHFRIKETWEGKESVKKILNGGGGLSVELVKDATIFFSRAKLLSAYGMTETCSSLTFLTLYDPARENSGSFSQITGDDVGHRLVHQPGAVCVGKPAPHVELTICSEDSSRVGRILTRGPHVMLGYWGQISTEGSRSSDEGWLDSGDIGTMDDYGNVWLIGRSKGRIKTGGENVYPEEVEAIISQHPGVSGIVVVGLPDARLTEMVVACVQLRDNWRWTNSSFNPSTENKSQILSSDILREFCRDKHLTRYFSILNHASKDTHI